MSDSRAENRSPENQARQKFELLGRFPEAWREHAHALLDVATMLWTQIENARGQGRDAHGDLLLRFGPIAEMLGGLGIEALAKAVRVAKDPKLISDGKWPLRGHDLVKLISSAGLELDPSEKGVLVQLKGFIEWAGRYPIPLDASRLTPKVITREPPAPPAIELPEGTLMSTEDRHVIDRVARRLDEVLKEMTG